ncbi:LOW QUALITY PROTEIN: hypothetical protein U9M48_012535, partial [Paspalum notatum var. saurae]
MVGQVLSFATSPNQSNICFLSVILPNFFGELPVGGQNKVGMLLAGAAAFCWALWLTRNDILFNKCKPKYILLYSREPIGFVSGLSCNIPMIRKKRFWRHAG